MIILIYRPPHSQRIRWLLAIGILILVILIHLLAVRTGLIIFYLCAVLLGGSYFYRSQNWTRGFIFLMIMMTIAGLTSYTIPTIHQKIGYMLHDWHMYTQGAGDHYSDSERLQSYQAGIRIWLDNPFIGTGYGDVLEESHLYYDRQLGRTDLFKLPHSQWLLTMAGSGILGLFIFIAGWFVPLLSFRRSSLSRMLLFYLYAAYTLSFFVENTLERAMSVSFFVLLACLLIKTREDSN